MRWERRHRPQPTVAGRAEHVRRRRSDDDRDRADAGEPAERVRDLQVGELGHRLDRPVRLLERTGDLGVAQRGLQFKVERIARLFVPEQVVLRQRLRVLNRGVQIEAAVGVHRELLAVLQHRQDRIDAAQIFHLIREHRVTHYCGAPIVHNTLINAPAQLKEGISHKIHALVAAAAPPAAPPAKPPTK